MERAAAQTSGKQAANKAQPAPDSWESNFDDVTEAELRWAHDVLPDSALTAQTRSKLAGVPWLADS